MPGICPYCPLIRVIAVNKSRVLVPLELIFLWERSIMSKQSDKHKGFPGVSVVKDLPAVQETQESWVPSLGQEDPLEKGMATHSSILAWRILWTEEPGGLQFMGSQTLDMP